MNEKELLDNLVQIDGLLARCVNPALNRADHDGIRQVMSVVVQRIKLSYKLEDERQAPDMEAARKEVIVTGDA